MAENTAVIPISTSNSQAIPLGGAERGCFQMPAAFTGTTVDVQISIDGTNFTTAVEEGAETNPITIAVNGTYALPIKTFSGKYFRLVSNGTEAAARSIAIYMSKP